MTVLTFLPRFAPKVKDGTKGRTIRKLRKRPIKQWHDLSLRQWSGRPYGKGTTQIILRDTVCTHVGYVCIEHETVRYADHYGEIQTIHERDALDRFARLDGFDDWSDMVAHFNKNRGLPFTGVLIEWDV